MSFAPKHLRLPLSKMAGCPWNLIDHRGVRIVWCAPGDHERDGENIADDLLKLVAIGEAAGELLEIRHRKMAEKDAEIELLRGDLKGAERRWHLACEDIAKRDAEIERLREAVEMAWGYFDQCCLDQRNMVPNSAMMRDTLAAYLRERDAVSSTDTRPPDSGVQSGVQEP